MGKKGSEVSPSKRYPLRSTLDSGRVLRSASNKNMTACDEPHYDIAAAQPAERKRKSGNSSGTPNSSVRVLRSASKNNDEASSVPLNGSTAGEQAANGRKYVTPSKAGSPNNSVRKLRSASKNKDEACSEPLNGITAGEQAANGRKCVTASKVGSPNNSFRVLRSASKNKSEACSEPLNGSTAGEQVAYEIKCVTPSKVGSPNNNARVLRSASKKKSEACSEPLNDNTAAQPYAKKRKSGSPLKVGSPVSSARVLRSNSKMINETFNEPLNDSPAAQPASRKRNTGTPPNEGSPKLAVRVLSSATKKDACVEPLNISTPVQPAARKRKSDRSAKERSPKKDYLKICQRFRYVLNRMNYEQSLIQAYAGEGWKGQSSEKIKPEKELERAKAEILRCKIKIREAFQNMDSLLSLSEGKHEESLFDSAGEIFSEDIFCAICGSKEVTLENDIILCDGACDRGFHQNCLNPPLLSEEIPPGNVGWFCPACMCKIDCMDALNELQGSKLSIHDSWEKVFPEAALFANDFKQLDASNLPLRDPENNEYNPSLVEGHTVNEGRCSTKNVGQVDDLGLPSEDSEDDDFDPAVPDSFEDQKGELHSEESDFTSDSDDFCTEIAKSFGQGETSVSPLSNVNEENGKHAFMEAELDQDVVLPASSRRQVERLDYKKLYDETYEEESSSSSDDEEWSGNEKLEDSETDGSVRYAKGRSRRASAGNPISKRTQSKRHYASVSEQQTEALHSNGSNSASRHFDPITRQKLKDYFEKDPYPNRATKESLARELGLTFIKVDKWFRSTRHSSRVAAAKKGRCVGNHTTENNDDTAGGNTQVIAPNDVIMALAADRNAIVHEDSMVQNKLDRGNKEHILLPRAKTVTEAYNKESSDPSDDKEWSGTSTSQKELEDIETDSLAASNHAKRLARRAPVEPHNNEHTPLSAQQHGSVNEQLTEAPCSNGSSSKAQKYHFGPIANQKLKVHFEKDPYPSCSAVQSLAEELGLTFIQVRRWFNSTRHYSSSAAKKVNDPGNRTNEKNDSTAVDIVQGKESTYGAMENPNKDTNDMSSQKFMLQINLNEGNIDDILLSKHTSGEETIVTTPAISRELDQSGYGTGGNQEMSALWNTGFEQGRITTPATVSRDVLPGYLLGENHGFCASQNTISEPRILMTPTSTIMSISQEVGLPGYGSGENQGNNASWNTTSEQIVIMTPTASSRDACPPGFGPGEGQVSGASWSWNSIPNQRVDTAPSTISRPVGLPGYGPGGNQVSGASWNTCTEPRVVMTPSTAPIEVGPPGYWPGEYQSNTASWNHNCEESVFMTPTTTLSEVGPPGYWSQENKDNRAPTSVGNSNGKSADKPELADEARKKAIARELRRMKKFR